MSLRTKFRKASVKDRIKVTVNLSELEPLFKSGNYASLSEMVKGQPIVLHLLGPRKILFEVNRQGKTAASNTWPFRQPDVGHPVEHLVTQVSVVNFE
jgi:hypothetical protein